MTKHEYLDKLRELLSYELPERLVKKNIDFYSAYFDEQSRLGKSIAEICGELGDPQLIARSCIDAEKAGEDGIPGSEDDIDFHGEMYRNESAAGGGRGFGYENEEQSGDGGQDGPQSTFRFLGRQIGCGGCLLAVLIFFGAISLLSSLFASVTGGGSLLMSTVLLALMVYLVVLIIRKR